MRGKIIAVFGVVVLIVAGLGYALSRATLGDLATPGESRRGLAAASAQLRLEGLVLERWLAARVLDAKLREPFHAGTAPARAEAATAVADGVRRDLGTSPEVSGLPTALVVLVDKDARVLGRNGSALMRNEDLSEAHPALREALAKGIAGSDVWVNRARNEQMLTSYASIRDADGSVVGGLVVGTALNDERLSNAADRTSGHTLLAGVRAGSELDLVGKSSGATVELAGALAVAPARDDALRALASPTAQVIELGGLSHDVNASAQALEGYGNGHGLVLIAVSRIEAPAILKSLLWPFLGAAALGLLLVVLGAYFLDDYISRPISELEDGLLAVINGRGDLRFEIEHAVLGGLVFRINSLLNLLLDVPEDETDEQGRPSRGPAAASFVDALSVDERVVAQTVGDSAEVQQLREETADSYYERLFREYVQAKLSLGDPVDHITREGFVDRIIQSERDTAEKHGRPVRFHVEVQGREVVLVAVPIG